MAEASYVTSLSLISLCAKWKLVVYLLHRVLRQLLHLVDTRLRVGWHLYLSDLLMGMSCAGTTSKEKSAWRLWATPLALPLCSRSFWLQTLLHTGLLEGWVPRGLGNCSCSWALGLLPAPPPALPPPEQTLTLSPPSLFLTQNSPTPHLLQNMGGEPGQCPQPSSGAWQGVSCWC